MALHRGGQRLGCRQSRRRISAVCQSRKLRCCWVCRGWWWGSGWCRPSVVSRWDGLGTRELCHGRVVVVGTEVQVPARWRRRPKGEDVHTVDSREDGVVIQVPGEGATQVGRTGVRRRRRLPSPDAAGCNVVTGWVRRIYRALALVAISVTAACRPEAASVRPRLCCWAVSLDLGHCLVTGLDA